MTTKIVILSLIVLGLVGGNVSAQKSVHIPTTGTYPTRAYTSIPAGKCDGVTDISAFVTSVISSSSIISFPSGTCKLNVSLLSNREVYGAGENLTTIIGNGTAAAVFSITGTSGSHKSNVKIHDLTIKNGTPSATAATAGMDGIRADYCDHCTFERLNVTSIQGNYGIVYKNSTYIKVLDNRITNFTYAGINTLTGCSYIWIERNVIDTATRNNGVGTLAYGIASGYEAGGETAYPQWVWIRGNVVRNIPTWEGIDFHGGAHLWITDNTVENVYRGILAATTPANFAVLQDVHILRNTVIQGTGNADDNGIIVDGDYTAFANGVHVRDNNIVGFGSSGAASDDLQAAIKISFTKNAHITGNNIRDWNQSAILLRFQVINSEVSGNYAYDMAGAENAAISAMIIMRSGGTWGISIKDNFLVPSSLTYAPSFFLRMNVSSTSMILGENYASHLAASMYSAAPGVIIPYGQATIPVVGTSKLMGQHQDPIYDNYGRLAWTLDTGGLSGFWSLDSTDVISLGTITAGSTTVDNLSGGLSSGLMSWFPEGMNITIAGAGVAGANLNTKVIAAEGQTSFTIDTAATTSVSGANILYQAATIKSNSQYLTSRDTFLAATPAQGVQFRPDPALHPTVGASWGIAYSSTGAYLSYNAHQCAAGGDCWHQTAVGNSSYLLIISVSGIKLYVAAPGSSDNTFASFWQEEHAFTASHYSTGDDIVVSNALKGLVLKDTQGTPHYWRVTVNNSGVLVITDIGTTSP